ncbi:MAG TPA: MerR family DNA-binding transcriptional regulator [Candidatus Paceibacterota bacterium]|nr:MerR family DNA-binding transcriptional regulator [Candidatus Paceibacterota bacterium]
MSGQFLTIKQASTLLGVSALTLRNWDKNGKLSAKRHPMSNYRIYLREDIDKLAAEIMSGAMPIKAKQRKPLKRKLLVRSVTD